MTVGFGNPDILDALTRSPLWSAADLSSVRFVITGGAPVPEPLIRVYLDRGVTLLQGYGLSEAGPVALLLDPRSALERIGSAGKPPLFVDVRIEGAAGGRSGRARPGSCWSGARTSWPGTGTGRTQPGATLTSDGWLRTGDAARIDDDGYTWIVGRVADSFIIDGQVVHPGDVKRVLL